MWMDPLVEEVRQRRRKLMAEFDYNPQKFLDFLKTERGKYLDRLTCPQKKRRLANMKNITIEEFLEKYIEGYLLCDLEKMAKIELDPSEQYGGAGYPMVASILSGMELIGGLLSTSAFIRTKGNCYFQDYWRNYLSKCCPRYNVPGLNSLFRNLVRHGLAHTFLTKMGILVTKNNASSHLAYENQKQNILIIDAVEFYEDFKNSYLGLVKPIAFQGLSSTTVTKNSMQDRLDEMLNQYLSDSIKYFGVLPPKQIPAGITVPGSGLGR